MRLLLDTDLDTDCDDAGALAVLHGLAIAGRAEILGIVCSVPHPACVRYARAINRWYGREELPVGRLEPAAWALNPAADDYRAHRVRLEKAGMLYTERMAAATTGDAGDEAPAAVDLYRRLLARQPTKSVTVCAIGTLTALAELLRSAPDAHSPLAGRDLVAAKVDKLVSMARGDYPEGQDLFNWRMDPAAAAFVLARWPAPVAVQPAGKTVMTGRRFMQAAPAGHPVKEAYRIWLGSEEENRPSWDQLTVLYAVNGAGGLFAERRGLSLTFDPHTRRHQWSSRTDGPERVHLAPARTPEELAAVVEESMIASLG